MYMQVSSAFSIFFRRHTLSIENAPWAGTEAMLSGNLPVRFTFIHFSTPARRKRSHSAASPEVITCFFSGQVVHVGAVGTIPCHESPAIAISCLPW